MKKQESICLNFMVFTQKIIDNIEAYLANTLITTSMGIAFAYVIRLNAGMCGLLTSAMRHPVRACAC